jgi:hypothetical protein
MFANGSTCRLDARAVAYRVEYELVESEQADR